MRSADVGGRRARAFGRAHDSRESVHYNDIDLSFMTAEQEMMIPKVAERAIEYLEANAIDPTGPEFADMDQARIRERQESAAAIKNTPPRNSIERCINQLSTIMEAVYLEEIEQSNWLPGAETKKTCDHDDVRNGVDLVTEFPEQGPNFMMGLAVDLTFASKERLQKKLDRLRDRIQKGQMTKIDYYHSENFHITGSVGKLPLYIAGVDAPTVVELAELWGKHDGESKKALGKHRAGKILLYQLHLQADAFSQFAKQSNQPQVAERYTQQLQHIKQLLEMRGLEPNPNERHYEKYTREDRLFEELYAQLHQYIA